MISALTDERMVELYRISYRQEETGAALHFARAIEKEVLSNMPTAPRGAMRVPGFILSQWDTFNGQQRYIFSVVEMPDVGYATVCPYTLEFDLPQGVDAKAAALDGIKTQQAALERDFAAKQQALELRRQEITGKPD